MRDRKSGSGRPTNADEKRFYALGTRLLGSVALLLGAAVVVVGIVDRDAGIRAWVVALMFFLGVLVWAALLRQTLVLTSTTLVLHNMFDDVTLPLTTVEDVTVRQVLVIRADGRRFVSAALGRTRRQQRRDTKRASGQGRRGGFGPFSGLSLNPIGSGSAGPEPDLGAAHYEALVQDQILNRRDLARGDRALAADPGTIERRPAWIEIALLAVTLVVTVVLFLLR